jgi:hypothetical protein
MRRPLARDVETFRAASRIAGGRRLWINPLAPLLHQHLGLGRTI